MKRDESEEHVEPLDCTFAHTLAGPGTMVVQLQCHTPHHQITHKNFQSPLWYLDDTNATVRAMGCIQRSKDFTLCYTHNHQTLDHNHILRHLLFSQTSYTYRIQCPSQYRLELGQLLVNPGIPHPGRCTLPS